MRDIGSYSVSEDGVVYSHSRQCTRGKSWFTKERILKHSIVQGYHKITLFLDGKNVQTSVHRVVAQLYIDNPENKPAVNHIDGNKDNNHYTNLEWCTNAENNYHAYRTGLKNNTGENNASAKLTESQVIEILKLKGSLPQKKIGEKFNVSRGCIRHIFNGAWKNIDRNNL